MTDTPKADERLAEIRATWRAHACNLAFSTIMSPHRCPDCGMKWRVIHKKWTPVEPANVPYLLDEIDRRDAERDELRRENARLTAENARLRTAIERECKMMDDYRIECNRGHVHHMHASSRRLRADLHEDREP